MSSTNSPKPLPALTDRNYKKLPRTPDLTKFVPPTQEELEEFKILWEYEESLLTATDEK